MTGDQRHTDHIATGQQLSRNSLTTLLCFTFFPTSQNILKFRLPTLALAINKNGTILYALVIDNNFDRNSLIIDTEKFEKSLKESGFDVKEEKNIK